MSDRLTSACQEFLEAQHCTLWARSFDIKKDGGVEEAAAWLATQLRGVLKIREERNEASTTSQPSPPLPFPRSAGEQLSFFEAPPTDTEKPAQPLSA